MNQKNRGPKPGQQNHLQPQEQQNTPKNPADPSRGRPQHFEKSGKDGSFGKDVKARGAEDESRGEEGGVSPGAQEMQRDKFSGERLPRSSD